MLYRIKCIIVDQGPSRLQHTQLSDSKLSHNVRFDLTPQKGQSTGDWLRANGSTEGGHLNYLSTDQISLLSSHTSG